jgi:hypothetical protein
VSAAAATSELGADDRDDLDARLPQECVGERVAVVREDHARLQRHGVVAAVPLLALGLVDVATGLDDPQGVQPECAGDDVDERRVAFVREPIDDLEVEPIAVERGCRRDRRRAQDRERVEERQ